MENSQKPDSPAPLNDAITRVIAKALFKEQGDSVLWAGSCCGRVSVAALAKPAKCGTCGRPADVIEVRPDDLTR